MLLKLMLVRRWFSDSPITIQRRSTNKWQLVNEYQIFYLWSCVSISITLAVVLSHFSWDLTKVWNHTWILEIILYMCILKKLVATIIREQGKLSELMGRRWWWQCTWCTHRRGWWYVGWPTLNLSYRKISIYNIYFILCWFL